MKKASQSQESTRAASTQQEQPSTTDAESEGSCYNDSNFSPEFWDELSKVWLTPRALRELDRRHHLRSLRAGRRASAGEQSQKQDLARFARHGGPGLQHLRQYLPMDPSSAWASSHRDSENPFNERRASAYDANFEQYLIDNSIYPPLCFFPDNHPVPMPNNHGENRQILHRRRSSLSLSLFSEPAFREFQRTSYYRSEGKVMREVIPLVAGSTAIPNEGNLPFTNLRSMTRERTVKPAPDFFDGARRESLVAAVREKLGKEVLPTKHARVPIAPNFFLEAKVSRGDMDIALRQALHDGAHGARAMHRLQMYGQEEQSYDGNADTYSSTYQGSVLRLYEHHVSAPTTPGGHPGYHMTLLGGYMMDVTREAFVQGATAFRNLRDRAKEHRDRLIAAANAAESGHLR